MSFLPADLHLTEENGVFTITMEGQEIFRSGMSKRAIRKFNDLKKEVQEKYPTHDLSPEEKAEILQRAIGDSLVGHNSLKTEPTKKPARSRTFG